jgi:hypothetical protein
VAFSLALRSLLATGRHPSGAHVIEAITDMPFES